MPEITRETFEAMDIDSKLNVLFDYTVASLNACGGLEDKYEKLEKKAIKLGSLAGGVATVGGYLAHLFIAHITGKP